MITYVSPLHLLRDSPKNLDFMSHTVEELRTLSLSLSLSRMDIINDFTEDDVSFLLDIVHQYYQDDPSLEPLIEKLWKLDRLIQIKDIRTDKAWRQS